MLTSGSLGTSYTTRYVLGKRPSSAWPFAPMRARCALIAAFAAAAAGLAGGVLTLFARRPSLATLAPQASARLAGVAAAGFALFLVVASFMVLSSNLILLE